MVSAIWRMRCCSSPCVHNNPALPPTHRSILNTNIMPHKTTLHASKHPYAAPHTGIRTYSPVSKSAPIYKIKTCFLEFKRKGVTAKYCSRAKYNGSTLKATSAHPPEPLRHAASARTAIESMISAEKLGLKNGATSNDVKCHLPWPMKRVLMTERGIRSTESVSDFGGRRRRGSK